MNESTFINSKNTIFVFMEHFVVSARKYRPTTFKSVVGQQAIINTLENAIDNNHLAQALLFTGPRGVGKTTCARILAKKINQKTSEDTDEDFAFNIFELDAASNNSVEDIRSLTDQVRIPPQVGKYKIYIIDEVHMLSTSAFNAFLKTLEEPPKHAIFILATTEKHKIIPTILSRCQIFDFKRITLTDIKNHLAEIAVTEGIQAEDDALHIIAQKADGALRDALSIFDRVVSFSGKNLTRQAVTENLNVLDYTTFFETTQFIIQQDIPNTLVLFDKVLSNGFDGHHFISGLASHFRDLLVCQHPETLSLLEVGEQVKQNYAEQSKSVNKDFLLDAIRLANDCDLKYKSSKNQRLLVELCLMQLCSISDASEKKKSEPYIIPPKAKKTSQPTISVKENPAKPLIANTLSEPIANSSEKVEENKVTPEQQSQHIAERNAQKVSAFSLKSIEKMNAIRSEITPLNTVAVDLPNSPFSEIDLQAAWNDYARMLHKKGEKMLATILENDLPKLNEGKICVTYPNDTMKKQLEETQHELLNYLAKQLNNHQLHLNIQVNEAVKRRYTYTTKEKFDFLNEKHPIMGELNNFFDFDL